MRNVITEAGMFAIREDRYVAYLLHGLIGESVQLNLIVFYSDYVTQDDLNKAARKVGESKKHESES